MEQMVLPACVASTWFMKFLPGSGGQMGKQASPHPIPQGFDLGGALVHQRVLPAERGQAIKCPLGSLEGRSR
ncbi:MAG: hypothetical protein ACXVBV_21555, partial [Isosphaeraceae bacterium]